MRTAIFPGTFDPFTKGHADIVERGRQLFDRIIVAVGVNEHKASATSVQERIAAIEKCLGGAEGVEIAAYFGLTTDFARENGADFILRGVRSIKDYEYEREIADVNHRISGIETVILFSRPELAAVSSSIVKELAHFGKDVSDFLP